MPNNLPLSQFINPRALADQATIENALQIRGVLGAGPGPYPPHQAGRSKRYPGVKKLSPNEVIAPPVGVSGGLPMISEGPANPSSLLQSLMGGGGLLGQAAQNPQAFPMQDMGDLPEGPVYQHVQPGEYQGQQVGQQSFGPQPQQHQQPQYGIRPQETPGFGTGQLQGGQGGQGQQAPFMSDAGMWGLISAGLGILANNYGNYGQASPAIGKGGLIGVNTFLQQRQVGVENKRRDELAAADAEWRRSQAGYNQQSIDLQGRRLTLEEQRAQEASKQDQMRAALAVSLAGPDTNMQKIAASDPDGFLKFTLGQLKPEYKERSVKDGATAYDEYSTDGGKNWNKVPGGGKYDLRAAKGGSDIHLSQEAKTTDNFNEGLAKDMSRRLVDQYEALQTIPSQMMALDEAESALKNAGGFVGSGAETKLAFVKFLNNNLGTQISAKEVENAEVFRSASFRQIMDMLKKLDSNPTQKQQEALREALGGIGTDPDAAPRIIKLTRDILGSRAKEHNRRVRQSEKKGAVFQYDITIPGFDDITDVEEEMKRRGLKQ